MTAFTNFNIGNVYLGDKNVSRIMLGVHHIWPQTILAFDAKLDTEWIDFEVVSNTPYVACTINESDRHVYYFSTNTDPIDQIYVARPGARDQTIDVADTDSYMVPVTIPLYKEDIITVRDVSNTAYYASRGRYLPAYDGYVDGGVKLEVTIATGITTTEETFVIYVEQIKMGYPHEDSDEYVILDTYFSKSVVLTIPPNSKKSTIITGFDVNSMGYVHNQTWVTVKAHGSLIYDNNDQLVNPTGTPEKEMRFRWDWSSTNKQPYSDVLRQVRPGSTEVIDEWNFDNEGPFTMPPNAHGSQNYTGLDVDDFIPQSFSTRGSYLCWFWLLGKRLKYPQVPWNNPDGYRTATSVEPGNILRDASSGPKYLKPEYAFREYRHGMYAYWNGSSFAMPWPYVYYSNGTEPYRPVVGVTNREENYDAISLVFDIADIKHNNRDYTMVFDTNYATVFYFDEIGAVDSSDSMSGAQQGETSVTIKADNGKLSLAFFYTGAKGLIASTNAVRGSRDAQDDVDYNTSAFVDLTDYTGAVSMKITATWHWRDSIHWDGKYDWFWADSFYRYGRGPGRFTYTVSGSGEGYTGAGSSTFSASGSIPVDFRYLNTVSNLRPESSEHSGNEYIDINSFTILGHRLATAIPGETARVNIYSINQQNNLDRDNLGEVKALRLDDTSLERVIATGQRELRAIQSDEFGGGTTTGTAGNSKLTITGAPKYEFTHGSHIDYRYNEIAVPEPELDILATEGGVSIATEALTDLSLE